MTDNIVKLYETGPWSILESTMAEDMMEYDYNPHCKEDVLNYFRDVEGEANGTIQEMVTLFNLPVKVTLDFFPNDLKE